MRIKLTRKYTLGEILFAIGGRGTCDRSKIIEYVCTDTREICRGDLFFPLAGRNYNGEDFVDTATEMGAIALSQSPDRNLQIDSGENALLRFAIFHLSKCSSLRIRVAITGSVGKTSVKEFTKFILSSSIKTHATTHNYNNRLGLAHTLLSTPTDTEALVVEMGMNSPGEISEMSKILSPNIAVITNIGTAHIGRLGSREKIAEAKGEICDGMSSGIVLCPKNEPLLFDINGRKTLSWGDKSSDFYFNELGDSVTLFSPDRIIDKIKIPSSLLHIKESVYFSVAIGRLCSIEESVIREAVCKLSPLSSRGRYEKYGGFRFYDDSYNSSPESVLSDLKMLISMNNQNVSLLLGDILELGEHSEDIHRNLGKSIASFAPCHLFLFGNFAYAIAEGAISEGYSRSKIFINPDLSCPIKTAFDIFENCSLDETILMKASHGIEIKRISLLLEEMKNND